MTKSIIYLIVLLFFTLLIFACQPGQTQQSEMLESTSTSILSISETPYLTLTTLLETPVPWGKGSIQQVVWSPDGKTIAVAGSLGIFLYSTDTTQMQRFIETDSWVFSIAYSPNGDFLASSHMDGHIHLWNTSSGELIRSFEGHSDWAISLAFSNDGTKIASGGHDDAIRIWDAISGELIYVIEGYFEIVYGVEFSPSDMFLASSSIDGIIRLWDVETGELVQELEVDSGQIHCVAFASDDRILASGSGDNKIRIWDTSTGEILQTLEGHTREVISVAFHPDGLTLASSSYDSTIRIWDLETGETLEILEEQRGELNNVAFNPEGSLLASASWSDVYVWEMPGGRHQEIIEGHTGRLQCLSFNPEETIIASGDGDGKIYLWQVPSGELVRTIEATTESVYSIVFISNVHKLISGDSEGAIHIWDVESGNLLNTLEGHTSVVNSMAISTDGRILVSGSWDKTIRLWDLESGEQVGILEDHNYFVDHVAFSPDDQLIASAGWDRTIKIWEVNSGKLLNTLSGHQSPVTSVAFSHNGLMLASGSWDNTVRLWDTVTGFQLRTMEGHTAKVSNVAFSPDDRVIASASSDRTIILWDVETGNPLGTLEGHKGSVSDLAFSNDGNTLISGGWDGHIRMWDLDGILQTAVIATRTLDELEPTSTVFPIQVIGVVTPTPMLAPQPLSTQGPWFLYTQEDEDDVDQLWAMNSDGTGLSLFDVDQLWWNMSPGVSKVGGEGHIVVPVGVDLAMNGELLIYRLGTSGIRKRIPLYSSEFRRKMDEFEYDDEYEWVNDPLWAAWRSAGDFMWSPNGRYLAFTAVIDGPSGDVYVYDTQTNAVHRVTSGPNQASIIDWSPDSRWIVHAEWVNGKPRFEFPEPKVQTVWAVTADGSGLRRLYDLSWYATAEIVLGWMNDEVFVVESKDFSSLPLPHSHLRTVNLYTGEVEFKHEGVFEGAALDSETAAIIISKTIANGGMDGLYIIEKDSLELVELDDTSWYVDSTRFDLAYGVHDQYTVQEGEPCCFVFDSNHRKIVTFSDEEYNNVFVPSPDGSMLAFEGCTISTQHCGIRIYERNGVLMKAISIAKGVRYIRWSSDSSMIWLMLPPFLYSYRIADDEITMLSDDLPDVRNLVLVEK